jgi:two-component system response regulator FixJ
LSKPPVIAIVDDDAAVREALCDLLQVEGLAARPFESGTAFLADATAEDCDCLVTDVRMPEIDGIELYKRLRARGAAMPVIFITSSDDQLARARALQHGAVAWFTKPVADEALLGALRTALKGPYPADTHEPPGA